jgi:hypothetical protein
MASLEKRNKNLYRLRWIENGERKQKTFRADSYKEAMERKEQKEEELLRMKSSNLRISELWELYKRARPRRNNEKHQALLNISPFSKAESHYFDRILNDRNLIIHHGGIYTMRYKEQEYKVKSYNRVFMDSLVVGEEYFIKIADFLKTITEKLNVSSS